MRLLEIVASSLPRKAALRLGAALGETARILGVRRSTVAANLRYVGMEGPDEGLLRDLYRNMGKYLIDSLRLRLKPPPHRLHGGEVLAALGSKGTVVLVAHLGNFELLASVFGTSVGGLHVIVKPMHNPYVERWLQARRRATGVRPLAHEKAAKKGLSILRGNGILAALVDQHPGRHGSPGLFLGRPAVTVRAIAGLQVRTGASLLGAVAILGADEVYDVFLEAFPSDSFEDAAAARSFHNEVIGAWVRKYPAH